MGKRYSIIIFAVFAAALYGNSVTGGYLIDDTFLVRDNEALESFAGFVSYFTEANEEFGRPVRLLSFYLDTALFGKSPLVYHVSNICYYIGYCTLVYFFCLAVFENRVLSVAATLLFIAHPLHTEGVSYISGRKDLLGGLFSFAALLCFVRYLKDGIRWVGLLVFLFFLLAAASKETYAGVALLLPLVALHRRAPLQKYRAIIAAALGIAALFILYVVLFRNRSLFDYFHTIPIYGNDQGVNFPTAIKICGIILSLVFHPFSLSADYTYNAVKRVTAGDITFLLSLAALFLAAFLAYYFRRRHPELSFGLIWILICLLPVCQIIPYPEIISERSLIFLSFGACLVLGALLVRLPRAAMLITLAAILVSFSAATLARNRDWQDGFSLWQAAVHTHPDCARARYNFGCVLAARGAYAQAAQELRASLLINPPDLITVPDYSLDALLNLGNVSAYLHDYGRAAALYRQVLVYQPDHEAATKNLELVQRLQNTGGLGDNLSDRQIP